MNEKYYFKTNNGNILIQYPHLSKIQHDIDRLLLECKICGSKVYATNLMNKPKIVCHRYPSEHDSGYDIVCDDKYEKKPEIKL